MSVAAPRGVVTGVRTIVVCAQHFIVTLLVFVTCAGCLCALPPVSGYSHAVLLSQLYFSL